MPGNLDGAQQWVHDYVDSFILGTSISVLTHKACDFSDSLVIPVSVLLLTLFLAHRFTHHRYPERRDGENHFSVVVLAVFLSFGFFKASALEESEMDYSTRPGL